MARSVREAIASADERICRTFVDLSNFTWLAVSAIWTIVFLTHLSDARMVLDTYQISDGFNFEVSEGAYAAHSAFNGGDLEGEEISTFFANWFVLLPGGLMWYLYGFTLAAAPRTKSNPRGVRNFRFAMGAIVLVQLAVILANGETLEHATNSWWAFS